MLWGSWIEVVTTLLTPHFWSTQIQIWNLHNLLPYTVFIMGHVASVWGWQFKLITTHTNHFSPMFQFFPPSRSQCLGGWTAWTARWVSWWLQAKASYALWCVGRSLWRRSFLSILPSMASSWLRTRGDWRSELFPLHSLPQFVILHDNFDNLQNVMLRDRAS